MFRFSFQRACRSLRMAPVGSGNVDPPVVTISQIHPLAGFVEHNRSRDKQLWFCARVILSFRRALGGCHVLGFLDKLANLFVDRRVPIHPKALDGHLVGWRFFRIVPVRTHEKSAARDPDHIFEWRLIRSWGFALWQSGAYGIAHNFFLSGIFVNLASLVSLREPIFGFFLPPRRYASKAKLFFTTFSSPPQQRGEKERRSEPNHPTPCAGSVSFSMT